MIDLETERDTRRALTTWRCSKCNRILAKLRLGPDSAVELKCGSCNTYSYRSVESRSQ